MGCNCNTNCNCGNLESQVSELQDSVNALTDALQAFLCGHPIQIITDLNDIALFDGDGLGTGCYKGWAYANGGTFTNPTSGALYTTQNLIDRFIVGGGGTYAPQSTGGVATVSLTAAQNGTHGHATNNPAHGHTTNEVAHTHGTSQTPHNHALTMNPHSHTGTTDNAGEHNHTYAGVLDAIGDAGTGQFAVTDPIVLNNTGLSGIHAHTFTTNVTTSSGAADDASISITVQDALTGLTINDTTTAITVDDSGAGDPHENLPPFYSVIFIQKL